LGRQWIRNIVPFWEILRARNAREIEASARALIGSERRGTDTEFALGDLIKPLALLERGQVAAELHDEMLNHRIQITRQTALTLAEAGDWQHVRAICPWSATAFAGTAEGVISRRLIALLPPVFRH
jgi:hypothetical protein